jgi:hypothetical protein
MAEVLAETVTFLWHPYLPLRKLTLLEGDPGQCKNWLTPAIAACGSVGRGLPGMDEMTPFRSLFVSVEDGKADTFRPRLDALGTDTGLVFAHDQALYLDTPEGMAELEREIEGREARFVVIDSVMSFAVRAPTSTGQPAHRSRSCQPQPHRYGLECRSGSVVEATEIQSVSKPCHRDRRLNAKLCYATPKVEARWQAPYTNCLSGFIV